MKKFDLYEALKNDGFELTEVDAFGGEYLTKKFEKEVDVLWYGKMTSRFKVVVRFSSDHNTVTANYFKDTVSPFKTKVHLNDKKAYNAINATIKNNEF